MIARKLKIKTSTLMLLLLFGVIADILTTEVGLENGAYELNPVARFLLETMGDSGLWFMKMLIMTVAALLYAKTRKLGVILGWAAAHYAIVVWNIIQLFILMYR